MKKLSAVRVMNAVGPIAKKIRVQSAIGSTPK
jgi:hypothetical protein